MTHREFSKEDVEALVEAQVRAGNLDASDPERVFTLVLPPGATLRDGEASSTEGLGGFHGNVTARDGHPVYYAVVVYSQRSGERVNGIDFSGTAIDNVTITESHRDHRGGDQFRRGARNPDRRSPLPRLVRRNDAGPPSAMERPCSTPSGTGWRPPKIGDIPVLNAELKGDSALESVWGPATSSRSQTDEQPGPEKAELAPEGELTTTGITPRRLARGSRDIEGSAPG